MITSGSEFDDVLLALRSGWSTTLKVHVVDSVDDELVNTLCAFGNMPQGGSMIFGLDPHSDFRPTGGVQVSDAQAKIQSMAHDQIMPAVEVRFYTVVIASNTVLIANIHGADSSQTPHRVCATRKPYLRSEAGNRVMSSREVQLMSTQLGSHQHDRATVEGSRPDHLDTRLAAAFLDRTRATSRLLRGADDATVLSAKGILSSNGQQLTLAGLYALGRYPQGFFPNLTIQGTHRMSDRGVEVQHFEGPLPVLLDQAVRWVVRSAGATRDLRDGAQGYRGIKVPILAVREVLANALIHRDLSPSSLGQRVHLLLEDDRLTVTSPGGLWNVSIDELARPEHETAVNNVLYELCRLTPVGGGHPLVDPAQRTLREVHAALRRVGMYPPQYVDSGVRFTVVLGRRIEASQSEHTWLESLPQYDQLTPAHRNILLTISRGEDWDLAELDQEFGRLHAPVIHQQLEQLRQLGLLATSGGHVPRYRLNEAWQRDNAEHYDFMPLDSAQSQPARLVMTAPQPEKTTDEPAARAAASSKHGAKLWKALQDGPKDIHAVTVSTQLSLSQARYAMQRLVAEGLVLRQGGQGHRQTLYSMQERFQDGNALSAK